MKKIKLLTSLAALPVVGGGIALTATSCSTTPNISPIPGVLPEYSTLTLEQFKGQALGFVNAHAYRAIARQPEAEGKILNYVNVANQRIQTAISKSQVIAYSGSIAPQWWSTGQVGPWDEWTYTGFLGIAESIALQPEAEGKFQWPFTLICDVVTWKNNEEANHFIATTSGEFFVSVAQQPEAFNKLWGLYKSTLENIVGTLPADPESIQ